MFACALLLVSRLATEGHVGVEQLSTMLLHDPTWGLPAADVTVQGRCNSPQAMSSQQLQVSVAVPRPQLDCNGGHLFSGNSIFANFNSFVSHDGPQLCPGHSWTGMEVTCFRGTVYLRISTLLYPMTVLS